MTTALEVFQMMLAICTSYCFYRDGIRKDEKSIYFGTFGLFLVSLIEIYHIVKEL